MAGVIDAKDENARRGLPLAERIDPAARGTLKVRERAGLQIIEARLPGPFRAMFTTRLGGVSSGPFSALNLDIRSEDDPLCVQQNRAAVAAALADDSIESNSPRQEGSVVDVRARKAEPRFRLVSPAQVHGTRVVGAAEYVAAQEPASAQTQPCDGLTLHPVLDEGLAPLLLFADCVPIILVGEVDMAVVHAGWRGMVGGIVQQAGYSMTGAPGLAIIGPSLGPCCFTVGSEVAEEFRHRFGPAVVKQDHVDLWAAAARALAEIGVSPARIVNPRLCTACNRDLFYSYRAEGPRTGRHGCAAWTVGA